MEALDSFLTLQNMPTKVDATRDASELRENDDLVIGHGILISLFI